MEFSVIRILVSLPTGDGQIEAEFEAKLTSCLNIFWFWSQYLELILVLFFGLFIQLLL